MNDDRPDPDRLLDELHREEEAARRGRLKIFFGACAGVGKTYAMLSAARQRLAEGEAVLAGIVETHGRAETARLLDGLPRLPSRAIDYRGRTLAEFDLDAALAIHPPLLLVDELAHSNVPGSHHAKRWQDVEELLAAGIDVYSTLNVQHLESLNDVVGSITGIRVRETVPDRVFDAADEVTLVDLPPDELLVRLHEGKVYMPDAAANARQNFFRKGNLIALREMALRRTADRVDAQMRAYRADQDIQRVWQVKERLLACVGADDQAEKVVRATARLATALKADWIALHVETPALQRRPDAARQATLAILRLAEELGAETVSLAGSDLAATVTAYAQSRNTGKLVLGQPRPSLWQRLTGSTLLERLGQHARDLDIHLVSAEPAPATVAPATPAPRGPIDWRAYGWAAFLSALATLPAALLLKVFDPANVVMVYLLAVVLISIRFGRGPGALAACLAVLGFDFFFVPPRFSFTVADTQYLFTFTLMLAVALIIGQLAARLRFEAVAAQRRERGTAQLARLARELSAALTTAQIVEIAELGFRDMFRVDSVILLPDQHERVRPAGAPAEAVLAVDAAVAQWVYDHQAPAGRGTATLPASPARYLPLKAPMRTRGVLAFLGVANEPSPEERRLMDTCVAQIALALERVHYVEVAQDALLAMESDRLRNTLLTALSHDLRTPLTSLIGVADTLQRDDLADHARHELLQSLQDEARRMGSLVGNLLDMARLQAEGVTLKKDWQSIEEVAGSALRHMSIPLARHAIVTDLPADLPLCEFDALLIERVLVNLLDNAAKYTPPGSEVRLAAHSEPGWLAVSVSDDGPGLPPGDPARLFDKFTRGQSESAIPGVGLGLALCRTILDAHGGQIRAENRPEGGARFTFRLPLGEPPPPPDVLE
ncbi:sensor histidine kinase [Pseudogulbenkiania subflava]|uniref:histidine kinase n=1 Tax=Pseudogulbenkiania subflava DSM 22618 TaxID=1123014 RepID=A0A1Y6BRG3_9NEIS|nr:sensor histidine kinase KdpD [Pseudogulbenkiania subflava]SMF17217.1 two-component system, OmpR family, sensor histidine kinase KdpD [Pseudogulbenkiania subflava DSM 22618]